MNTCKFCKKEFEGKSSKSSLCSDKCITDERAERNRNKKQKKFLESGGIDGVDYITCKEVGCGYMSKELASHIIHFHKMEIDEYKSKHGVSVVKCSAVIDVFNKNNPGENHGGKLSPFSKKFIKGDIVAETARKVADNRKTNGNDTTSIEYYLKKTDGNVEEAQKLLSERQTTFSKEICIEKHGEEAGIDVWKERQVKWQDTINNISDEEMFFINAKKFINMAYVTWLKKDPELMGKFYIILLDNGFFKIGVTSNKINERYKWNVKSFKILYEFDSSYEHCMFIEQIIKFLFRNKNIDRSEAIDGFGWTETYKNTALEEFVAIVSRLQKYDKAKKIFDMYYGSKL